MTVLSTSMSLRRLQMVAKLRRISLQHNCQNLVAGEAVSIDSDSKINVKYDNDLIKLNSQGELTVRMPAARFIDGYLSLLETQFPAAQGHVDYALVCDGINAASWQPVGEYYSTITNAQIDNIIV